MKWNEIINDFKNGYSVSKLSEKYNISYYKINNYLIKNNLKINFLKFFCTKNTTLKCKILYYLIKKAVCKVHTAYINLSNS